MTVALNLARFRTTPLTPTPFPHLIVPQFLAPETCLRINENFPRIRKPGSFPLARLSYGDVFTALIEQLRSDEMRHAFAEKFDVDLTGRPTMITVRGRCGPKDGRIHTDSVTKIITVLLYLNPAWAEDGGRLRLLRSENLGDVLLEVPPEAGTLLCFRRSDNSFHGHKPFVGERRVVQLNWVTSSWVLRRETWRHSVSAFFKGLRSFPWGGSDKREAA